MFSNCTTCRSCTGQKGHWTPDKVPILISKRDRFQYFVCQSLVYLMMYFNNGWSRNPDHKAWEGRTQPCATHSRSKLPSLHSTAWRWWCYWMWLYSVPSQYFNPPHFCTSRNDRSQFELTILLQEIPTCT
jgi:hypothetical protein